MTQTHHLRLAAGLLALLFAPAVDRWVERLDAWLERRAERVARQPPRQPRASITIDGWRLSQLAAAAIVRLGGAGVNGA